MVKQVVLVKKSMPKQKRHIMKRTFLLPAILAFSVAGATAHGAAYTVHPDQPKQVIKGIGFEIQSDSIGSGNQGLPEEPIAVPHDLVPAERERLAKEMLKGFRYCRLAGGLYWRGVDKEGKFLQPRWPEQLQELKQLLDTAGVEGLSLEYWSPAPYWKGNRSYLALPDRGGKSQNVLRCFAPGFNQDPEYKGDADRFLSDFGNAVVTDIKTVKAAGMKTSMFGLQNEPNVNHFIYSSCEYPTSPQYVKAYRAVAGAIRKYDPSIMLFADTEGGFPKKIGPAMGDPKIAALVDAYAVHTVGSPCDTPAKVHANIMKKLPPRPWFQNEYEYLTGGATPDRCLNTVQHIMNSFQLAENPTWFWILILKPLKNAEASGYSLGFWKSLIEPPKKNASAVQFRRWPEGPEFTQLPEPLKKLEMISAKVKPGKPAISYNFIVNQPVTVYLLAEPCDGLKFDKGWVKTEMTAAWESGKDVVYKHAFPAGRIVIPSTSGKSGARYAAPHLVFVEPSDAAAFRPQIGMNLPIEIRSETIALERKAAAIETGHWVFNPYNWNAVGSFVRHMPWDCTALHIEEAKYDPEGRIFAFKKPDGKVTIVVSNRSTKERSFDIATGLEQAKWNGFRYTPEEAGKECMGVAVSTLAGATIKPVLPAQSWEFWEQQ